MDLLFESGQDVATILIVAKDIDALDELARLLFVALPEAVHDRISINEQLEEEHHGAINEQRERVEHSPELVGLVGVESLEVDTFARQRRTVV